MGLTLELGERQSFLQRYFRELEDWRRRDLRLSRQSQISDSDLARFQRQMRRLSRWRQAYQENLPKIALARCPFTDAVLCHSYDPFGLDGLWWNYDAPVRPYEERLSTYFALTGAVHLGEPLECAPFLCKPGPGAPYVLPSLLQHPDIQAVVRELPLGPHRAFAVVYFARSAPKDLAPPNEWGTGRALVSAGESLGWISNLEHPSDFDFDLKPWLEQGKLHWISGDDPGDSLKKGSRECPYLDLSGERKIQRIESGKVWTE